jgi:PAS domain S-box-containing protein
MRILSVDDNAENLYLIDRLVCAHGHEVASAHNGLEALAVLERQPFDLIVSDILMPEMDGFQLCHEVKSRERTHHIPFIFYTATYTSKQDEELALSLGASRFVVKPTDPEEFMAIVQEVIQAAHRDVSPVPAAGQKGTLDYLKAYTARLVSKLDHKIEQLETARNELQSLLEARDREIEQRRRAEEELKGTEAALRESEERFRRAILEAPVPIMIHAEGGRIEHLNRAWQVQSGYSAADLQSTSDWARKACSASEPGTTGDDAGLSALERLTDGCEIPIRTASGRLRTWAFDSASLGLAPDGRRLVITMAMDVTERRSLEQQLAQAQKMEAIGQLAGGVAHDFNNMLTVISGYSELLLRSLSEIDPAAQHVKEIAQAAGRAAALTRQLLAFSRKQVLQLSNVDINSVIRESENMLRRLIGEDVEIRIACASEEMRAMVDAGQLAQVVMNLAVNARDAMPQGGLLTIETSAVELGPQHAHAQPAVEAGQYVQLAIRDTGIGMDKATLAHIFEPFFTTKGPGAGTGLGLCTVYGIVKQSNGHIQVDSEPGRGTAFRIYLPRVFGPPKTAAAPAPAVPARGSETVLLVEDEPSLRELAREILRRAGYKVIDAANGGEALLACEKSRGEIALMITDLVMPGMSGQELAQRLALLRPEMKVLYMSGYSSHAAMASGAFQGRDGFIQKPFSPHDLADKVRRILDRT